MYIIQKQKFGKRRNAVGTQATGESKAIFSSLKSFLCISIYTSIKTWQFNKKDLETTT